MDNNGTIRLWSTRLLRLLVETLIQSQQLIGGTEFDNVILFVPHNVGEDSNCLLFTGEEPPLALRDGNGLHFFNDGGRLLE
jgi:hypothetical protein